MLIAYSRFVHLFLLSSERAWATAMHMKSHHAADSGINGITGSTRRHIGSRLHRASIYAANLVDRLKEKEVSGASSQDIQEARAYYVSMRGNIEFEKQNWEKCLREYSEARLIYAALARSGRSKKDDLFRDLTSTTIEPSIRYAAYQLKLPRTTSIDKIVARYVPRNNEYVDEILKHHPDALDQGTAGKKKGPGELSQDLPSTITWRSRTVSLEDAAIAQALATVSAAETKLSSLLSSDPNLDPRAKAAAYDEVLIPSQDAVDATKTAIDELTADGIPQGDRRMQALQITRTAVNYALVGWRIGRNRILCGDQDGAILEARALRKPKKPRKDGKERKTQDESRGQKLIRLRERVVLYDATLQSLDSVKELPGVAADQAFLKELDGKRAYFATLRYITLFLPEKETSPTNSPCSKDVLSSHALMHFYPKLKTHSPSSPVLSTSYLLSPTSPLSRPRKSRPTSRSPSPKSQTYRNYSKPSSRTTAPLPSLSPSPQQPPPCQNPPTRPHSSSGWTNTQLSAVAAWIF